MLSSALNHLWTLGVTTLDKIQTRYTTTERSLRAHISMKPKDILGRSVAAGNWSTLLVIALCYPALLYFRGLDWQLLGGMLFMYASFWVTIFLLVLIIQSLWLLNYFISQRFVENLLDFEIVERILGQDRSTEDEYDSDSELEGDMGIGDLDLDLDLDGDEELFDRATG